MSAEIQTLPTSHPACAASGAPGRGAAAASVGDSSSPDADARDRDDLTTLSSFGLVDHQQAVDMGVDGSYERKVALLNREIVQLGFGKFQWWAFMLAGGGWAV